MRRNTKEPTEHPHCQTEFSYTFTDQETLGLSANDMLKVAGRQVKGMCAEGQHSNVAQAVITRVFAYSGLR